MANVLNERGHRTKAGKRWSTDAVLTVLRNRVYLGEIYFRGTWYRADQHHPALVDADLFEQAQQLLVARGDDHSKRASTNSEYTLAGLITWVPGCLAFPAVAVALFGTWLSSLTGDERPCATRSPST